MSAHVLLKLLNKLRKSDKGLCLTFYRFFHNKFNKFNNAAILKPLSSSYQIKTGLKVIKNFSCSEIDQCFICWHLKFISMINTRGVSCLFEQI